MIRIVTRNIKIFEDWAQDRSNSNIFLKPLFRGNFDPFVNIRAMAPKFPLFTERNVVIFITPSWCGDYWEKQPSDLLQSCDQPSNFGLPRMKCFFMRITKTLRSDCTNVQVDLNLHWAHNIYVERNIFSSWNSDGYNYQQNLTNVLTLNPSPAKPT